MVKGRVLVDLSLIPFESVDVFGKRNIFAVIHSGDFLCSICVSVKYDYCSANILGNITIGNFIFCFFYTEKYEKYMNSFK